MPATIEYPVRLKSNVVDRRLPLHEHRLLEARVACSTKRLRKLVRAQTTRIKNLRLVKLLLLYRNQMFLEWSMKGFKFDSGL